MPRRTSPNRQPTGSMALVVCTALQRPHLDTIRDQNHNPLGEYRPYGR